MIGLSIDPGMSTGVCLFEYDDAGYRTIELWQFPRGAEGLSAFLDHFGIEVVEEHVTALGFKVDALIVEKFTPWNDPEQEFSLTLDSVEPLRGEGVLIGRGFLPHIKWRQPSQQYYISDLSAPKKTKRKRSKEFLKQHGLYRTGSGVEAPDSEDATSAMLHAIGYLRSIRHVPTLNQLFPRGNVPQ